MEQEQECPNCGFEYLFPSALLSVSVSLPLSHTQPPITHTQTHTDTHSHTHTRTHTRAHTHTRTHARTHARARTHTHTHAHTRAHTRTHARTHSAFETGWRRMASQGYGGELLNSMRSMRLRRCQTRPRLPRGTPTVVDTVVGAPRDHQTAARPLLQPYGLNLHRRGRCRILPGG